MSLREIAYGIVDDMTEEQVRGFIMMIRGEDPKEIPNEKTLDAIQETEN